MNPKQALDTFHHVARVTRAQMNTAFALLPADVAAPLLGRARVSRHVAMRALGYEPSFGSAQKLFKKIVDAHPRLAHRLTGETRFHYRSDVIAELLLAQTRCATAKGRGK